MKYKKIEKPPRAAVRSTNSPYSKILVGMWDDFVDAKKRMESEGPFLLCQLGTCRRRVFDACAGTGADSIFLLKKGYDVTSNEVNRHFLAKAVANSRRAGVGLDAVSHNWLELDRHLSAGYFDGVLCLGSSLIHLFTLDDQLRALRNFRFLLNRNGIAIIDLRNYEYMLRNRDSILRTKTFRYSGRYVYCGLDRVHGRPVDISDKLIRMEYSHLGTGKKAYLDCYPFRVDELCGLLNEAGFRTITMFSDYRQRYDARADFYQFVCRL